MSLNSITFHLLDSDAVRPTKAHASDAGWDLTVIRKMEDKPEHPHLYMFDTGVAVTPPLGTFTAVVPRSSFSKSGFALANSFGVIDPSYTGTIKVALTLVDKDAVFPSLPWKCMQLLVLPLLLFPVNYVSTKPGETDRGDGGFGSSDKSLSNAK